MKFWLWQQFTKFVGDVWGALVAAAVAFTAAYIILRWKGLL